VSVEIEVLPDPVRQSLTRDGPIECAQSAVVTVSDDLFEQIWTPSTLEFLARSYWRFLQRRSLGLIKIGFGPDSRSIHLVSRRITLLRFHAPRFESGPDFGTVEWPIDRGLLVAAGGRGQGYLKFDVRHSDEEPTRPGRERLTVTSEVANFYPWLRGSGWFARLGTWLYSQTQLRVHIWITKGFLKSLRLLPAAVIRRGEDPGRAGAAGSEPRDSGG
jgi:hypothetical protein